MTKQKTLTSLFGTVKSYDDLLETLEAYQQVGIKYILGYGSSDIGTQELIDFIKKLETTDLDDIKRAVYTLIHS